jgi:hypothetical protein
MELLGLYFNFIHDQFHSHISSAEPRGGRAARNSASYSPVWDHGPIGKVCALSNFMRHQPYIQGYHRYPNSQVTIRFSTNPIFATIEPKDRGKGYSRECAKLLDLEDISLTTIQACILLGSITIADGKSVAEAVYYSVASRMALLLDLAHKPTNDSIEEEVNKRGTSRNVQTRFLRNNDRT